MGLQSLQGTGGGGVNSWECAFCRRRSRAHKRIVLTINVGPSDRQSWKCCDMECLRRLLALWEELETKKAIDA
jgi:hypothetical protein